MRSPRLAPHARGAPASPPRSAGVAGSPAISTAAAAAAVSAAAGTSAAAAAAAAAVSAAAGTSAAAAAAAAPALGTVLGLVDAQRAAVEVGAVHLLDRRLGRLGGRHLDEGESARSPGLPLDHQLDLDDLAELGEGVTEGLVGGRERQVTYVESISHLQSPAARRAKRLVVSHRLSRAASKKVAARSAAWAYRRGLTFRALPNRSEQTSSQ